MENEIVRNLDDGPDYKPDWRNRVVECYLSRCSRIGDEQAAREVLRDERDPFVRQATRFRLGVRCVNSAAFKYAFRAHATNRETGTASMIRAMAIADRRADEIAAELHAPRSGIICFLKMFFDIERFLGCEAWLRTIAFPEATGATISPEMVRERRWLAVAFMEGWDGLENALFHRRSASAADVKKINLQIQVALGSRALEYMTDLGHAGIPAAREDLDRFLAAQESSARQPVESEHSREPAMLEFVRALHAGVKAQAKETDNPVLAALGEGSAEGVSGEKRPEIPRFRCQRI